MDVDRINEKKEKINKNATNRKSFNFEYNGQLKNDMLEMPTRKIQNPAR